MSYREKEYKYHILTVEDGIATITYNRPKAFHAVNLPFMLERTEIYNGLKTDPEIRVLISTGDERAYSAGGDLKDFVNFGVKEAREFIDHVVINGDLLTSLPFPTIAMVAGLCLGGGLESAIGHDLRIAADNAVFGLPEINVGIFPGGGATQRLPQIMSLNKAKELVFLGEMFDAQTALQMGIVNKVVPLDQLKDATMELAKKLCTKPPFSLRMAKEALNAAWSTSLDKGLQIETHGWAMCYGTEDQVEGMRAFIEKRAANYQGK
ncbi:MAG: hypothetical protein GXY34_13005 [Syntrophomonadaceae bacterium]|nr:hypothetical protein [Syntrophomonadaceae bacterium]